MYGGGEVSRELGRNEKISLKTWRVGGKMYWGADELTYERYWWICELRVEKDD